MLYLRMMGSDSTITQSKHQYKSVPKVLGLFIYSREGDFSLREPLVKIMILVDPWDELVFLMFLK